MISSSQIVTARDEDHARELLRDAGAQFADESALRRLAHKLLDGSIVLVRHDEFVELDEADDVSAEAPLLTLLTATG